MSDANNLEERSLRVPAFCPVCSMIMKGPKSNVSHYEYGCCILCKIWFVEGREERWNTGWRPSKEEIAAMSDKIDSY